jgi:bifunctional DNA-binding transcriptional regulator/antitoxin component of YhaV-PrlF toxin-antitoxin module
MATSDREEVTTTVEAGPPKYQIVIPQAARRHLGIEGKKSTLQITIERLGTEEADEGGSS